MAYRKKSMLHPSYCYCSRVVKLATVVVSMLVVCSWTGQTSMANGYERLRDAFVYDLNHDGDSIVDAIRRRGLLKVGVGLFEPWVMCNKSGDLIGYEIDVATKLASDLGVRIAFERTDWYFIVPALIEDKFDLVISGMGITPERGLLINFTIPYSEFGTLVLLNIDELADPETISELNNPDVILGARAGTVPAQVISELVPQATTRFFDSDQEMLVSLLEGEIHGVAVDQIKATQWLHLHPDQLASPFDLFNKVPEAIALRKQDFDGLNFLNGWIQHYASNGWLAERRSYWFKTREWEDRVVTDPDLASQCEESFDSPYL